MDEDTKELNKALELFRLASRDLKKNCFLEASDFKGHEHCIDEGFADVQKLLFETLVRYPCAIEHREYENNVQIGIEVKAKDYPIDLLVAKSRGHMNNPEMSFTEDTILLFDYFDARNSCEYDDVEFQIFRSKDHPETAGFRGCIKREKVDFGYRRLPSKEDWGNKISSIFFEKRLTELFEFFADHPDEAAKELLSMPKIPFQYYMYGFDMLFLRDWFKISEKAVPAAEALFNLMKNKLKNAPDDFGPFVYELMGPIYLLGNRPDMFALDKKSAASFAIKYQEVKGLLPPAKQRPHS